MSRAYDKPLHMLAIKAWVRNNCSYGVSSLMGVISSFLNSTSEPSACNAILPLSAVQLLPYFTRSPLTHIFIDLSTHSMIMVFHCPSGFSELSVRLIILLPLPSVMPQFSFRL